MDELESVLVSVLLFVNSVFPNQLTRCQRTWIGYFEVWHISYTISTNMTYLREIWPHLVLSDWKVSLPLALCMLILSQGSSLGLQQFQISLKRVSASIHFDISWDSFYAYLEQLEKIKLTKKYHNKKRL